MFVFVFRFLIFLSQSRKTLFLDSFDDPLSTIHRVQEYGDDFEDYNEDFEDEDVSPPPLAVAAAPVAPAKSAAVAVSAAYVSLLMSRRFASRLVRIALPLRIS